MCDHNVEARPATNWFRHASLIRSRAVSPRLVSPTFRYAFRPVPNWRSRRRSNTRPTASFQKKKLGETVARFCYVGDGSHMHRDALEFPSGKIVLLTRLCDGQRATVLQLPAIPHVDHAHANEEQALVTVG